MASPIDVVFNADTQRFVAQVNAATGAVSKQSEAVAAAKNKILEAMEAQVQKAAALGASQAKLSGITETYARKMTQVTEQNADRTIEQYDRILAKKRQLEDELKDFKIPKASSGHDITDRQASSALLRGGGLRADETFLASIPGAGKAVQALFPLIGGAGLAGLLFEMGEKGLEAFHKVQHAAEETRRSFEEAHDKAQVSIDDKEIENQKIQDQIDKISGKPNNGLAMALLEARKMSDQLITSLQASRHEMDELFKQNQTGKIGSFLSFLDLGPKDTSDQEKNLRKDEMDREKAAQDARDRYAARYDGAKTNAERKAATNQLNQELGGIFDSDTNGVGSYRREIARLKKEESDSRMLNSIADSQGARSGSGSVIDNSQKIAEMEGVVQNLRDQKRLTQLDTSIFSGDQTLGQAKQNKADNHEAEEAARKAFEAQKERWKQEDDKREQSGENTPYASMKAWQDRIAQSKPNSEQQKYANNEYTSVFKSWAEKDEAAIREAAVRAQKAQREAWQMSHDEWTAAAHRTAQDEADFWSIRMLEAANGSENYRLAAEKELAAEREIQKQREEADKARSKALLEQGQQQTAYAEAVLGIQRMTGQISRQDAAIQLANIHTEQYRQKLAALNAELARQQGIDPNSAGTVEAQAAVDKAGADRRVQVQQDAAAMAAQTWSGALKNANAEWVQDAEDSAKQVVQLWQQAFSGLNDNLEDLMVGDKSHFGQMFKGIGKTLAGDALKRLEAPAMQALGLGKPDGTESNPLHVKLVGTMGQGTMGGLGRALFPDGSGLLGGGAEVAGDDDASGDSDGAVPASGASKAIGGIFGALSKLIGPVAAIFGGHRALGGRVQPGMSYDVGEMGREEFVPDQPGTMVPNNQIGGRGASYVVNVANGVTPEQMQMHVQAALQQFHPQVVRSSLQAMHEQRARGPVASH